ncbi:hypothetical protein ENUP19_0125G0009 [Entamoeba nuttalli]|uniref:tRNA nucleotidyltransferase, putative n=2 Tax=Entamoeba nuttalli TaxID=412467 RepID=K2HIK7_ENTNP|nr:tRNA nucleotidyltransferase, putative [Entamoeba nuttalli P19]EKE42859.1 tRNA nucleotidyltransferase, putative [Entamoeba nuttalli P19]|eukprot:XP_008854811.1 tRNA nucleotidyltransferase, putative [Entamoeba nuttalli P19]
MESECKTYNIPIDLTQQEIDIFKVLNNTKQYFNLSCTVRVVGGWVRDKILKKNSHDIDITSEGISGVQFAQYVTQYLQLQGINTKLLTNREQTEHLQTATTTICELPIDFGSPRAEEYKDNSRIPEIRKGSIYEDCIRRDFTINCLFYRIEDGMIEDYTNGYEDLVNKIIRTPIDPIQSFTDDPLRVFRGIRFSAKYGFKIEDNTLNAMTNPSVLRGMNKIKKSRRTPELNNILISSHPSYGFHVFQYCHLLKEILITEESNECNWEMVQLNSVPLMYCCEEVFNSINQVKDDTDMLKHLLLTALCYSFKNDTFLLKKKELPMIPNIIIEGLKFTSKEREKVDNIIEGVNLLNQHNCNCERLYYGRSMLKSKEMWKASIILYCCLNSHFTIPCYPNINFKIQIEPNLLQTVQHHFDLIYQLQLDNIWLITPAINGSQITQLYQTKKGKWVSTAINSLIEYQISNPTYTVDSCKEFLLQRQFDKY